MFDVIREQLETIDLVLDPHQASSNKCQPKQVYCAPFLLFQVKVQEGVQCYQERYLRGFQAKAQNHPEIAASFLREVQTVLDPRFDFPQKWMVWLAYPRTRKRTLDQVTVRISCLGGNFYFYKNGVITLYNHSKEFGSVLPEEVSDLEQLLIKNLRRHPHNPYGSFVLNRNELEFAPQAYPLLQAPSL